MEYPNIWGEGALFSFSALEGTSHYSDDFCGILLKDIIGIKFFSKEKRILCTNYHPSKVIFNIVSSDYISFTDNDHFNGEIIYADEHLIVGTLKNISIEGNFKSIVNDNIHIQASENEYTALLRDGNNFSFAYGHAIREVIEKVKIGISLDKNTLISKKMSFFNENTNNKKHEKLQAKCLSVMKTQLYSKEKQFDSIWSTPDRLPHKKMWLWDSIFHSIGFRNVDTNLSMDLINALFVNQEENGFIPHMMAPDVKSKITQPPLIAYGAYKTYKLNKNKNFLLNVFNKNKLFLNWIHNNRRLSDIELYTWNTTNKIDCKCDESGMDNSSRFDTNHNLYAIDFSSFMANEARYMSIIANELGLVQEKQYYANWFNKIKDDINKYLYSPVDGFFFDYDIERKDYHKIFSVSSFLPLFANICDNIQAKSLTKYLNDEMFFKTNFMVPTIAKMDKTYGTDMWRGPVWINYNYMIIEGLRLYDFNELANSIKNSTIETIEKIYNLSGVIFEFYDSENIKLPPYLNRKGVQAEPYDFEKKIQTIRDYGWSTTLLYDLLCER